MKDGQEHISLPRIESYLEGRLEAEEAFDIEMHIGQCERCAERVRKHRGFEFALGRWSARRHGELKELGREVVGSRWRVDAEGIYRVTEEIKDQIRNGLLSAATLLFLGHRRMRKSHLGRKTEVDCYKVPLPEGAGAIHLKRMSPPEDPDSCSFTVLAELSKEKGRIDLIVRREEGGDEDGKKVIWRRTVKPGETVETGTLSTGSEYSLRLRASSGTVWDIPLPSGTDQ